MREYETVFVLHPQVDDAGVEKHIEEIRRTVQEGSGEVTGVYKWGRRKLAYPIRKVNEGFYTLVRFRCGAQVLLELDRKYKLNESILRHLTVSSVGDPTPPDHRGRDRRGERGRPRAGGYGGRGRGPAGVFEDDEGDLADDGSDDVEIGDSRARSLADSDRGSLRSR